MSDRSLFFDAIRTTDVQQECNLHRPNPCARLHLFSPAMLPLRFHPIYQSRVWGGRMLETELGRDLPDAQPYGESWELSDRKDAQSVVAEGRFEGKTLHQLWTEHRDDIFGAQHKDNPAGRFPILLKILDCQDKLSVQVHPPAHAAKKVGGEPKTEMWFVARADQDAKLYAGLRKGVHRHDFEQALQEGGIEELLHTITPNVGQSLLLPAGRIHALGAGLVIYEIQQNSDSTFRVYDWNRPGLDGKPRDLHIAQSLECINFHDFEPAMQDAAPNGRLPGCPHFIVRRHTLKAGEKTGELARENDFSILGLVHGSGTLVKEKLSPGDFRLIPANVKTATLTAGKEGVEWLEVTLP